MKNSNFVKNSILTLLPISLCLAVLFGVKAKPANEAGAYSGTSLTKMDVYLNDTPSNTIRAYYSNLNSLTSPERKGENLLKNLKPILMKNQKYYNYDSGDAIWKLYEIVDRDWEKSPASSATNATYDSINNVLKNYTFRASTGNDNSNPYLHALYVNRDDTNLKRAWGDHGNRSSEATIEREHIWPKSHGFDDTENAAAGARGDPMHLWAADGTANGMHNNYFYGYVDKAKSYDDTGDKFDSLEGNLFGYSKTVGGTIKVFEPQDSDKGDIARACFYMVARYNNISGTDSTIDVNNPNLTLSNNINNKTGTSTANTPYDLGILSDLLEWNRIDPPDEFEIHRNNLLYTNFTNNRNPFIDFPQWADICFGNSTVSADPVSDEINGKGTTKVLKSISVASNPSKTVYTEGEKFSSAGMVINGTYSDNSVETITDYTYSPDGELVAGTEKIAVNYQGKSVEIPIKVIPKGTQLIRYFEKVENNFTSGNYLIVCDNQEVAWKTGEKGSVNTLPVTYDENDNIVYTNELSNALFTFDLDIGSIYAPNKKYIYNDANTSEVKKSETPMANTILLKDGILTIQGSGGRYIKCNENGGSPTFCYYASTASTYHSLSAYRLIETSEEIQPESVTVSPSSLQLEIGKSENLSCKVLPTDATDKSVTWSSNNEGVATVDKNGRVVAHSSGVAVITAKSNDKSVNLSGSCTVTVPDPIVLDRIEISGAYKTEYYVGDEFVSSGIKVNAIYKQGNFDVETIDVTEETEFNGFDSTIEGKKVITAIYGDKSATFEVDVRDIPVEENTIKVVASNLGFENAQSVETISMDNYDIEFSKGSNSNATKYYTSGSSLRTYGGNKFTISGPYKIVRVSFVFGSGDGTNTFSVDQGTCDVNSGTWSNTSGVDKLTYTIDGSSGHRRISEIHVKYDPNSAATKELVSITLSGEFPRIFDVDDTFLTTGMVVTARYNDGSENIVSPTSVSSPDMKTDGEKTITVSYTENDVTKTVDYTITVNKNTVLDYITLSGKYKTEYFVGESFSREGLVVTAHYSDSSSKTVSPSSISGYDMNTASDSQIVTVTYSEGGIDKSETYPIKVKAIIPTKLEVSNVEKTNYVVGDIFNENLKAKVTYNNGTTATVTPTSFENYDLSQAGDQTVQVVYTEKGVSVNTSYNITVQKVKPVEITISGNYNQYFYVGDTFNYNGLIATVTYNNGTTTTVTPVVSTPDMTTSGSKTITVSYTEDDVNVSTSYTIQVTKVVPTKIILSGEYKTEFYKGDDFDSAGLIVTASFNNGSTKVVTPTKVTGYNMLSTGKQTVTVEYTDTGVTVFATYKITILDVKLESIELSGDYKTTYEYGESYSSEGLIVTAFYTNGKSKVVTPSIIEGFSAKKPGTQTITVSYKENRVTKTATYNIVVNEKKIDPAPEEENEANPVVISIIAVAVAAFSTGLGFIVKGTKKKGKKKNVRR